MKACFLRRRFAFGMVLLALVSCKDSTSVRVFKNSGDATETREAAAELEVVAKETGLKFPTGSRLLGVSRDKGIDYILQVKVEVPQSEFASFLAASPIDPSRLKVGGDGSFGPSDTFWDPSQASQLRTAQAQVGSNSLNIGAGTPTGGKVTVLITFFTT